MVKCFTVAHPTAGSTNFQAWLIHNSYVSYVKIVASEPYQPCHMRTPQDRTSLAALTPALEQEAMGEAEHVSCFQQQTSHEYPVKWLAVGHSQKEVMPICQAV